MAVDGNYILGVGHPGDVKLPDDMFDANTKGSMCDPGFFCKIGSPSSQQYQCGGTNKFCPSGSFAPTIVSRDIIPLVDLMKRQEVPKKNAPRVLLRERY